MTIVFAMCAFLLGIAVLASEEVPPADNLVISGIPPIPPNIIARAEKYTEFRAAAFVAWHPEKREMLITTRLGASAQIYRIPSPGAERERLTEFPDQVVSASFPRHNASYFVFSKDVGGNEFSQLYRFDLANGHSTLITDGKSRNSTGVWSQSGDRLAYTSTRRNGRDTDVYLVDPQRPETDRMAAQMEGGGWSVQDWSPDGASLILCDSRSVNESYLWRLDLAAGQKTIIAPPLDDARPSNHVAYARARFRPDGTGFYTLTNRDSEFVRLAFVDLQTRRHTYLTASIPWDVVEYDLSRDGRQIVFVTNEAGYSKLHLLDVGGPVEQEPPHARPIPELPPSVISGVTYRPDGGEIAFTLNSAQATNDAYSLDLSSRKLVRWTHSETNGVDVEHLPLPNLVRWHSFDGKLIPGFLYRPPTRFTGKRPVVINIHGGPEGQSLPRFLGQFNYFLDELGVAVIFPNVRGSTGYGKTYVDLDNGFLREGSYKDIGALLDWITTQPDLDSDRIMVMGGSYGGHMTLVAATRYADRIRCALDIVGMSNLVTFLERTEKYRQDLRRVEYGDERDPKMREFLESIAPLNHVDKITKPLFVVQGKSDPRVPYTESEQIVSAVQKRGVPVWYLMAKDEGHGFVKKQSSDYLFYATILFMQRYLLGD